MDYSIGGTYRYNSITAGRHSNSATAPCCYFITAAVLPLFHRRGVASLSLPQTRPQTKDTIAQNRFNKPSWDELTSDEKSAAHSLRELVSEMQQRPGEAARAQGTGLNPMYQE